MALAALLTVVGPASALAPDKAFHDYVKDTWSLDEGLPQITVAAITQDAQGYLWVGTQSGLARFDGVRFTSFTPENTPELPGLLVQSLYTDRHGRVWIGTYKGVAWYAGGRFHAVTGPGGRAVDVRAIVQDGGGRILVATLQGLFSVSHGEMLPLSQAIDQPVYSLAVDGRVVWAGGIGTLYRLEHGTLTRVPLPEDSTGRIAMALVHLQGRLWVGTSHGLYWHDNRGWHPFQPVPALGTLPIDSLGSDHDGNLWAGTNKGLARIHDGRLTAFVANDNPAAHRHVEAIYEDREQNLWLGSHFEGLARLWNGRTRRLTVQEGLHDPLVWSVARGADGTLWVGTNDGLSIFSDGRFRQVLQGKDLPHPNAYTLRVEGRRVWIGTRAGLAILEDDKVSTPARFKAMGTAQVNGIIGDGSGGHWFATTNGLFHDTEGALTRYGRSAGLTDVRCRIVFRQNDGTLLVGTQAGLYRLDRDRLVPVGAGDLPADIDVTAITQLTDGRLAVGTLAEDQLFIHGDHGWHRLGPAQGLPRDSAFFMAEDTRGYFWVAGIRGLYRVPIAQLDAVTAGRRNTVDAEMLLSERGDVRGSQKAYCCNGAGNAKGVFADGRLWLPTRGGVVVVDTRHIEHNPVPPSVAIQRLHYGDAWHRVGTSGHLDLTPDQRDLTFDFTALSFQAPRGVRILYQLVGYDSDWSELDDPTRRSVRYTNLPAGNYTFRVKAANNADVWNPDPARLEFSIEPRFYETLWFRFVVLASLLVLFYLGYRFQLRHLHSRQRHLESVVRQRTEELREANLSLQQASLTDPLTGLRNRRYLSQQLPADFAYFHREALKPGNEDLVMVFAMADLDFFKRINDRHGHMTGDLVLQQLAARLGQLVRTGDYIVRWGGEEFLLVLRPMPRSESVKIAERLRASIEAHAFTDANGEALQVTCSLGFAEYPFFPGRTSDNLSWEDMVAIADHALYLVKKGGRNGWAVLRPTHRAQSATLAEDIRRDVEALVREGTLVVVRTSPESNGPQ
jgi:diguanylate cyclase (GGDEF)-like protein